ncbi:MAG: hypothetical protein IJU03_10085, partial [Thermoguttaceae bacterium]|nr:hypothetical protein [Thermoguttaceae bacterium]
MKKNKKTDERNSLEQLLLRWRDSYNENKSRVSLVLVLIALVIIAIWLVRTVQFGGTSKETIADNAYYSALDSDGVGVAQNLKQAADAYNSNLGYGSVLCAETGDAFVRDALNTVAQRRLYSAGSIKEKPGDPTSSFLEAITAYNEATKSKDVDVKARAFYNLALVYENLASISPEAEVEKNLDLAKENLKLVSDVGASPYAELAQSRLAQLGRSSTVEYYKTVAKAYVELPEPSDTPSILSENKDELKVGEPASNGEEFSLNDDASEETSESAPEATEAAPETTEPAPEATEAAPETTEPAPETTEAAPETTEPAPEATEAAPETTEP